MDKLTLRSVTNVVRTSLRGRRETGSEAGKQRARYASAESEEREIRRLPRTSQACEHPVMDELGKFVSSRAILPFSVALQTSQVHP